MCPLRAPATHRSPTDIVFLLGPPTKTNYKSEKGVYRFAEFLFDMPEYCMMSLLNQVFVWRLKVLKKI